MATQTFKKSYKGYYITAIVLVLIVIFFLPIIPVEKTIPVQKTVTRTETLINDKPTVSAGYYLYYREYIDISGKSRNVVYVSVVETAGYDIRLYVFDQKGFNAWRNGYSSQPYVDSGRIKSYSGSFVPDHSDYYYFVFDNSYSWFTNKVPQITVTWEYQETITDYEKVRRYVSIFQLMTGTY